jgi:hypothetical protein
VGSYSENIAGSSEKMAMKNEESRSAQQMTIVQKLKELCAWSR